MENHRHTPCRNISLDEWKPKQNSTVLHHLSKLSLMDSYHALEQNRKVVYLRYVVKVFQIDLLYLAAAPCMLQGEATAFAIWFKVVDCMPYVHYGLNKL